MEYPEHTHGYHLRKRGHSRGTSYNSPVGCKRKRHSPTSNSVHNSSPSGISTPTPEDAAALISADCVPPLSGAAPSECVPVQATSPVAPSLADGPSSSSTSSIGVHQQLQSHVNEAVEESRPEPTCSCCLALTSPAASRKTLSSCSTSDCKSSCCSFSKCSTFVASVHDSSSLTGTSKNSAICGTSTGATTESLCVSTATHMCTVDQSLAATSSSETDSNGSGSYYLLVRLPDECLLAIFSRLEERDLCRAAQVCKRFYAIASDCELWRKLYQSVFEYDMALLHPEPLIFKFVTPEHSLRENPWKESFRQLSYGIHVRKGYRELYAERSGRSLLVSAYVNVFYYVK